MANKKIELGKFNYELIIDYKDGYDSELIREKYTDYFEPYDYILGDFSYDKVRLKGFYHSTNPKVTQVNDIKYLDNYIENYCAYGCSYFLLEKKEQKSQEK